MNYKLPFKLGKLVSVKIKEKVKDYSQEEYYCEWCEIVTNKETIYHKGKKLFLCDKCTTKADKGEL